MKLYHGTAAKYLEAIKSNGIRPRGKTKNKGNWKHTVESNRNAVYLTDAYAWHFAQAASGDNDKGLILEIDTDKLLPWQLCPDEDFMEQASRGVVATPENNFADTSWDMKKRTRHYRKIAKHNPDLAATSLEHMGTAAYYGTIPWNAVTRYVIIDWNKLDTSMRWKAADSMVSVLNYRFLKEEKRAFTKWFFNDPVDFNKLFSIPNLDSGEWKFPEGSDAEQLTKQFEAQRKNAEKAMANREGLSICAATT